MKKKYRFYDKEEIEPRSITFDFPPPFEENFDKEMKSLYGADLTFVKEINHRDRILRLHSPTDSGKGTTYIPALAKDKKKSEPLPMWPLPKPVDTSMYTIDDFDRLCQQGKKIEAINIYMKANRHLGLREVVIYVGERIEELKPKSNSHL